MRASAKWCRRLSERFAPKEARSGVAHLRHYSSEYIVVGEGEPLVLVPGLAGGYELLGRLVRVLAHRFQVVCFQLRGEQDAAVRVSHTLADLAEDLAEFQQALLLERTTVVGISFGSLVAIEFALRHPRRSGSLVLHELESHFRDSVGGRIARLALEEFPLPHNNPFFNQFFRLLFARREPVDPLLEYVAARCWSTDQSVIAHRLAMLADFDVRDRVARLGVPTLVVGGQDDVIVSAAAQQRLASSIPQGQFATIVGAGHLCFLTRPQAFARAITQFLRQTQARA